MILDSIVLTRSLPLPVLTVSKCDSSFEAKRTLGIDYATKFV